MLDDELTAFIQSGVSIIIGTRDSEFVPEIVRGWGARVMPDQRNVEVLVGSAASTKTLENLRENGCIAVTFGSPANYRTVQLKGRGVEISASAAADVTRAERHWESFAAEAETRGLPTDLSRNLYSTDLVKLRFTPDKKFDQTPGAGAGKQI